MGALRRRAASATLAVAATLAVTATAGLTGTAATAATAAAARPGTAVGHPRSGPQRIILDTDIGRYWDDVAALSVLNAAQSQRRARILGVMVDITDRYAAPTADAIDTYYGHGKIPIGVAAGTGKKPWPSTYSRYIATHYPNRLRDGVRAPDAVRLYRRLLAGQPDHSVTIVSIGGMTNLARLLGTGPDRYSRLTGRELVRRKVSSMSVMGGWYPTSKGHWPEYDFAIDPAATRRVVDGWPTRVDFDGFEVGEQVKAGGTVCARTPRGNPTRGVYDRLFGCGKPPTDGSFDPTTAYYALNGLGNVYRYGPSGSNRVTSDGDNTWRPGSHGDQRYLILTNAVGLGNGIDRLLDYVPTGHRTG